MKLKSIKIKNFRSIEEVIFDFQHNPRILVGINEAGKTNILNALRLLDPSIAINNSDIRELPQGGTIEESKVLFVFELGESELKQIYSSVKKKILATNFNQKMVTNKKGGLSLLEIIERGFKEVLYEVNLLNNLREPKYWALEEFKLADNFKRVKEGINYTLKDQDKDIDLTNYVLLDIKTYQDIQQEYFEDASFEDLEGLIWESVSSFVHSNLPRVIYWEYKDEYLLPPSVNLDQFIQSPNSSIPLKNLFLIGNVPENEISKYLSEFKNDFNRLQSRLDKIVRTGTKFFRKAWPEYKRIEFSLHLTESAIKCSVKELNKWDFQVRSDGFRRFIALLLQLFIPAQKGLLNNALILIDDVEIALHPKGCKYLLDQLKKLAANNYVVFSTHSIFMIDRDDISRHYIVEKNKEKTNIREASEATYKDEEVLYKALGASVYEILEKKNILFEGWTDKQLFEVFISSKNSYKKKFSGIGISHSGGVKIIPNILPILELAKRKCLIITDGDQPAREKQKEWQKKKWWGTWKRYDQFCKKHLVAEDFIKIEKIEKALTDILVKNQISAKSIKIPSSTSNRIAYIKNNFLKNEAKEKREKIINELKEAIFRNLKIEDIEEIYENVINEILKLVQKL